MPDYTGEIYLEINSNLKQHRHKVSRFYLELFRICNNFSGICFIPI